MPKDRLHAAAEREPTKQHSNTTPRSTTLPPWLQDAVPQCAQGCLAHYINEQYTCADDTVRCLCNQYSSQGFTVGELAYLCLNLECTHQSTEAAKNAYFACHLDPQAVAPTHATLTLPATSASRMHTSATSLHSTTTSTRHTTHRKATTPNPATTAQTALSATMGASRSQQLPQSAATNSIRPTSTSLPATHLTPAQATGISIAAMGTVILAIAVIYLISCMRRRKSTQKDERKAYDFIDEAPPRISPFRHGHADPRGPLGGFQKRRAELMADKTTSTWAHSHYAPNTELRHEKSTDRSPDTHHSNESNRSQLLPDKPFSGLVRPFQRSSAVTATTIFEEDRPQERPPPVPSLKMLPKLPPAGRAIYYPAPPPTRARMAQYVEQYTRSPDKARQPSLSLDIPRQAARLPRVPSPVAFPLPPNVPAPPQRPRDPSIESRSKSRESSGSFLNYYTSPEAGFDASPEEYDSPTTPIDEQIQRRKAVPNAITITKPIYPPRAIRVDSRGSDTSFESNATDEPTPPEEMDRQLTPVQESPINRIRYPKIPRSSNQAVARSPGPRLSPAAKLPLPLQIKRPEVRPQDNRSILPSQQPPQQWQQHYHRREKSQPDPVTPQRQGTTSSTLSGSTLAAKRLGNSAAQDLERRLYVADSSHSRSNSAATTKVTKSEPNSGKSLQHPAERNAKAESPLKGYGKVASGGRRVSRGQIGPEMKTPGPQLWRSPGLPGHPQEVTLKSPLWEPKLTPSRKGEDLYLSVGVATPMTAAFTPMTDSYAH